MVIRDQAQLCRPSRHHHDPNPRSYLCQVRLSDTKRSRIDDPEQHQEQHAKKPSLCGRCIAHVLLCVWPYSVFSDGTNVSLKEVRHDEALCGNCVVKMRQTELLC